MDVLEEILAGKRRDVQKAKDAVSFNELQKRLKAAPPSLPFRDAVVRPGRISVIAEMKKKSPSAGLIRDPFDVGAIAASYARGGVAALSVLTEEHRFGGKVEDMPEAKRAASLPILRKDFVFDPYQIVEARVFGADAVLLIADMVEAGLLKELVDCAVEVGIEPLVEVFTEKVIPAVLKTKAFLMGINTRNLRTLEMFPQNVEELSRRIPSDRRVVAESGIKTKQDIERLKGLPVCAVLVGESLLKQPDLEKAARTLVEAGQK